VLALIDPFTHAGEPQFVEGTCEGTIGRTPRGSGGFGYDPLFTPDGTDKTMAELDESEKNRLSHRAKAFAALRPVLQRALAERADQLARLR
jgi:XTP/dITP diphosphohydrolase